VWVFGSQGLSLAKAFLSQLPTAVVIAEPGIQTLSRMQGELSAGNSLVIAGRTEFAGVQVKSFPKLREKQVDLSSRILFTEVQTNDSGIASIRTNVAVRSRIQIPQGGGALLMSDGKEGTAIAVVLSAKVQ
jgi:hypothetical protein